MIHKLFAYITSYAPHLRKHALRFAYNAMSRFVFKDEPILFLNYGYADDDTDVFRESLKPSDRENHLSIRLYDRLLDEIPIAGRRVLDVGCGRGGGASYIARYLRPAEVVGVDYSTRSIAFCNRHHKVENLRFRVGDAEDLGFEPNSFDVVINVESSHANRDESAFFANARRLLVPDGFLCFCDVRPSHRLAELSRKIDESGLRLVWKNDISANVLRALQLASESRSRMIRQTFPRVMQQTALDWAGVEGGAVARSFAEGSRSYIACVLQKPADGLTDKNEKGAPRAPFIHLVAGAGLIRIGFGRFSPLRGALRASKTLARFVERGSPPDPHTTKQKWAPQGGPSFVW